jgi:hypothetical protein
VIADNLIQKHAKLLELGTEFRLPRAAMAMLSSTALADYYVVQEKKTKECKVVETRPTETTWVQVGPLAFKTRDEAEKQIKVICKKD